MEEDKRKRKGFRERFLNKRALLIIAIAVVVIGVGAGFGLVKASNNPAFCTACHIMKPYYESWQNSTLLANKHSAAGVTCHECHESSFSIQAEEGLKFVTGNYKSPLDKRQFPKDFCLNCHTDFESIKATTKFEESNPHDSHNGAQECNLCHSMHQQSKVMCSQCHMFDWADKLDGSWNKES